MKINKKNLYLVILFLPLSVFIYLIPAAIDSNLTFYPGNRDISVKTFNEERGKNSDIRIVAQNDKGLTVDYTLMKDTNLAFCGVKFFTDNKNGIDLSRYDYLVLRLKSTKKAVLYVRILSYLDGYSTPDDYLKFLYSEEIINPHDKIKDYKINFSDFIVPFWWLKFNSSFIGKSTRIKLKKIKAFVIQAEDENLIGVENTLLIEKIEFRRDVFRIFLSCLKIVFFIYIAMLLFYEAKKLIWKYRETVRQKNELIKLHSPVEMENFSDIEARKIFDFIKENYSSQKISLSFINRSTGVSESKISEIIRKYNALSFKQYLNLIRLEESKRLLAETDRQIIEIAFNTGYNNVTHFNRVFKKEFGTNPFEYRKSFKN